MFGLRACCRWERWAALAFVVCLLAFSSSATATPPSREQVRQRLLSYEQMPDAESWKALGPETLGVLVTLYNDASEPAMVRIRTVHAAGHYATPASRTFLLAVANAHGQGDLFVRAAVMSLGRAFGPESVADVRPFLAHREEAVREGAVLALKRVGTPAAIDALRRRQARERVPHVRDAIDSALREASQR